MKQHPGPAIRRARRAVEMTQLELAARINRSPAYICNFELGRINATPNEIAAMRAAMKAVLIGAVQAEPAGMVFLRTDIGGMRVLDMLVGDPLPRIC